MANVIKLKKGLTINLKGKAAQEVSAAKASKVYGLVPDAFWEMKPNLTRSPTFTMGRWLMQVPWLDLANLMSL